MSFLSGPECSTGANPLSQFQKQTSVDNSLQRDRLTSRQPNHLNGFRSQPANNAGEDAAFAAFAQQTPQFAEQLPSFQMEGLRREAERIEQSQYGGGVGGGGAWAGEFGNQIPALAAQESVLRQGSPAGFSPQDFAQFRQQGQRAGSPITAAGPQMQHSAYTRPMYGGSMGMGMQRPMYGGGFGAHAQQPMEALGKGKGRVQELSDTDWEAQFEELSQMKEGDQMEELDREDEKAMEDELNGIDRSETNYGDFESIWRGIQAETDASRDMLAEEEALQHLGDEYEQWKDFDGMGHGFDGLGTYDPSPQLGEYMFEQDNIFKDVPDAFEEGQKIMRDGGNLSLAALAFEAAVQKDSNFTEAWVALGQAQAQNEKESPAIRALEQALKLDPDNLDALMGLAVSYTNESFDSLAYRSLEHWVLTKYPSLATNAPNPTAEEELGFTDRHALHKRVTNLFLQAAQLHPAGEDVDVDVQVGLGVLFYGSEDYDKAVDCFGAALNSAQHGSMKQEGSEHLLWNRLGATLANSNRSEEAIDAYSHALEIRPNFVRARYNLGVSCINLGVLEEAASHLLGALSMHKVVEAEGRAKAAEMLRDGSGRDVPDSVVEGMLSQNQSTNLYDTLRRTFTQMGRRDLAERVGVDMDLEGMRGEFEF
ncbi:hypothetical protein B0A48_08790 [Cryoendolithus antarcticus]|uniref:Peroxisomal targeting signal receptor n=1 Tax=Cryoendolithus antarcticus TaxID=1507870 RepID=A0A1V8T4W1_9PEZI|nr:hypothetical protein B0A48_08790 [Cryoendolithus antarcticus]